MAEPVYFLNVNIDGYEGEVFVNDAPILAASLDFPCLGNPPISEWLLNGDNVLKFVIERAPHLVPPEDEMPTADAPPPNGDHDDTEAQSDVDDSSGDGEQEAPDDGSGDPILRITFCSGELGGLSEEAEELGVIDWTPPEDPDPPIELPLEVTLAVAVQHSFGSWAWENAPPLELDEPTIAEITQFVQDLHQAMSSGNINALIDAAAINYREFPQ